MQHADGPSRPQRKRISNCYFAALQDDENDSDNSKCSAVLLSGGDALDCLFLLCCAFRFAHRWRTVGWQAHSQGMSTSYLPISRSGPNAIAASFLAPLQRRQELCAILAAGLIRLRLRQSSELSAFAPETALHLSGAESVYRTNRKGEFR